MKTSFLYILGCLLLFLGLFWMFLPHAFHNLVLKEGEESSHLIHIFQGLVLVIIGLVSITLSNKPNKKL